LLNSNGQINNNKPYTTSAFAGAVNGRGEIESISNSGLGNATLGFTYDNLGRVISRTVNGAANSMAWDFDAAARLSTIVAASLQRERSGFINGINKLCYLRGAPSG